MSVFDPAANRVRSTAPPFQIPVLHVSRPVQTQQAGDQYP
jgi:hypothetical protein